MFLDRKLIIENQINQNDLTAQAPLEFIANTEILKNVKGI